MNILGISAFLDDPCVALLIDGKIIAICEEERLLRVKNGVSSIKDALITTNESRTKVHDFQIRYFPTLSIDFCLKKGQITLDNLDYICVSFDLDTILKNPTKYNSQFKVPAAYSKMRMNAFKSYYIYLEKLANDAKAKLIYVRHHVAHTYGTLFSSDFNKAITLTMDGMGDFDSTLLSCFNGNEFEIISDVPLPHSMGRVYSSMTNFLGFRSNLDEEKVMALAGYGTDMFKNEFKKLITLTKNGFEIKHKYFWHKELGMGFKNSSKLPTFFGIPRFQNTDPLIGQYKDIAKSLQENLFSVSSHMVGIGKEHTGYENLCLSGGVAQNSENNGRIAIEIPDIKNVFIQPQAGDAGTAIGAAFFVYFDITGKRPESMKHVYYGPSFSNDKIEEYLKKCKLEYYESPDIAGEVAEMLASGKITGWYQGSAEVGPRALGNRSILAAPFDEEMAVRINNIIKNREKWRPFAPTILDEERDRYLDFSIYSPFMSMTLPLSEKGTEELKATQHINRTTRPQTLMREINPRYYDLIKVFEKETGTPALLNTSFNVRDEPIVTSPQEAIIDFFTTGMDALIIGDFILQKKCQW